VVDGVAQGLKPANPLRVVRLLFLGLLTGSGFDKGINQGASLSLIEKMLGGRQKQAKHHCIVAIAARPAGHP